MNEHPHICDFCGIEYECNCYRAGASKELRKTREMVRELVGALREDRRKIQEMLFEEISEKYAVEIAQLGREQNGASSTKLVSKEEQG